MTTDSAKVSTAPVYVNASAKKRITALVLMFDRIQKRAYADFDELVRSGRVNSDNYPEIAESISLEIADRLFLAPESNAAIKGWYAIFSDLMNYAARYYPES